MPGNRPERFLDFAGRRHRPGHSGNGRAHHPERKAAVHSSRQLGQSSGCSPGTSHVHRHPGQNSPPPASDQTQDDGRGHVQRFLPDAQLSDPVRDGKAGHFHGHLPDEKGARHVRPATRVQVETENPGASDQLQVQINHRVASDKSPNLAQVQRGRENLPRRRQGAQLPRDHRRKDDHRHRGRVVRQPRTPLREIPAHLQVSAERGGGFSPSGASGSGAVDLQHFEHSQCGRFDPRRPTRVSTSQLPHPGC